MQVWWLLHVWLLVSMLHGTASTLIHAYVRIHESVNHAATAAAATARCMHVAATAACTHAVRDGCGNAIRLLTFMLEVVFLWVWMWVWEWFWWLMVADADWKGVVHRDARLPLDVSLLAVAVRTV